MPSMLMTAVIAALVLILVLPIVLAMAFRKVVPTNMSHIVQSRKASVEYGREKPAGNVYYAWPSWLPIIGISVIEMPESNFQLNLDGYDAYDVARLPFKVDVAAFFRIENPAMAAQRVSTFEALTVDLRAVLQGAVRRVLAITALEEILQARGELGVKFTEEVKEQLKEWGVTTVKSIEFMDLRDANQSRVIQEIMEKEQSRITRESRIAVAENRKAAETAVITAEQEIALSREAAEQQVGVRAAEKEQEVGRAREGAQQSILEASKETASKEMDVKRIRDTEAANIAKTVAEVQAEQDKAVRTVAAQAEKEVAVLNASGQKEAATLEAEGVRAMGAASAEAERLMLEAPVEAQIKLNTAIGANPGYQQYLQTIEQIRASQAVGSDMAKALAAADLKVIANGGTMQEGVSNLMEMFSPKGGLNLAGMMSTLGATEEGAQLLGRLTGAGAAATALNALAGGKPSETPATE